MHKIYTAPEAAEYLRIHPDTLRLYARQGFIAAVQYPSARSDGKRRSFLFTQEAIDQFIAAYQSQPQLPAQDDYDDDGIAPPESPTRSAAVSTLTGRRIRTVVTEQDASDVLDATQPESNRGSKKLGNVHWMERVPKRA